MEFVRLAFQREVSQAKGMTPVAGGAGWGAA